MTFWKSEPQYAYQRYAYKKPVSGSFIIAKKYLEEDGIVLVIIIESFMICPQFKFEEISTIHQGLSYVALPKKSLNTVKICNSALSLSGFVSYFLRAYLQGAYPWKIHSAIHGRIWISRLLFWGEGRLCAGGDAIMDF